MLLFCDGFDHYVTADLLKKWTSNTNSVINTSSGRRGSGALTISALGANAQKGFTALATVLVGFAWNTASASGFYLQDLTSVQLQIATSTDGSIKVYRGTGTTNLLGSSAAGVWTFGSYQYIEVKAKIDPTVGTVTVRVNGVEVLNITGANTRVTTNSYANTLAFVGVAGQVDDLYICDTTGTVNNDFLGDIRIDTLLPNADGTYSQFTPNSGTVHYTKVADTAPDTTSYNAGVTVGNKDTYQFGDLAPVTGSIKAIQVNTMALKDDAGTKSIAPMIRSGGLDAQGTTTALSTSQTDTLAIFEGDPATGYDPGSHRYWRINVSASYLNGTYTAFTEIVMRTVIGGAQAATGGTAISSYVNGGYPPANAFDGNFGNATYSNAVMWVGYDFGAGNAKRIVEMALTNSFSAGFSGIDSSPGTYTLEYSDDGTAWTVAKTITGDTWSSFGETHTKTILSTGGAWTESAINALEAGVVITA